MDNKLRTIRLYGKLGTKFGRVHRLAVRNAREAIRALCVILPGFEQELRASQQRGVAYSLFLGKENIGREQIDYPPGGQDIRIAPVLSGSKRAGVLQMIVGAALVVVGALMVFTGYGAAAGTFMMKAGAVMMASGVVQMLSPQSSGISTKDSVDNGASYNFNGAVNTSAQGNPVSLLFGRVIVGSSVIYGGLFAQDQL